MTAVVRTGLAILLGLSALTQTAIADESLDAAQRALAEGRFASAERLLETLTREAPGAVEPHALLGRARLRQGRFAAAREPLEQAAALDPDWPGLQRDLGAAWLHTGEHARARDALERALQADPDDATALVELGLAELELGRIAVAERHFERARRLDPSLEQLALYNIAAARNRAGDPAGSGRALRDAIAVDATSGAARRAQTLLDATPKLAASDDRAWRLSASAGLLHDDNVTTAAIDQTSGESDGAATADLSAGYTWRSEDHGWRLDAAYDAAQTSYFHEAGANLQIHGVGLSALHSGQRADAAAGYRYTLASLGGDRLMEIHELRPALQIAPLLQWFVMAGPRLARKDFADDDRDADQVGLGTDVFYFFRQYQAWVTLGAELARENASAARLDHDSWQARAALHLPFSWQGVGHVLDVSYRYQLRDYESLTASIAERRDDRVHGPRLRLARELTPRTSLRLDFEHTRSASNLPEADYRQNSLGLSLGYSF